MAEGGVVLKFPAGKPGIPLTKTKAQTLPPIPPLEKYDYDKTVELYQIGSSIKRKAQELVTFINQNRQIARQAGIELLGVQLTSILEGDRFQPVVDALEDAVHRQTPVSLTHEGLGKIHEVERLIADADNVIVHFMNGKKVEPSMGQTAAPTQAAPTVTYAPSTPYPVPYPMYPPQPASESSAWIPVVIIGIAGIIGVIAIIAITQKKK